MRAELVLIALVSGMGLAMQVGMNNALRSRMGNPLLAAFTSFLVGSLALAAYLAFSRPALPHRSDLMRGPWWIWFGGIVGAGYVASAAAFASKLGAAPWLGLIVTGQILASLAMDHFGLVGFPRRPINPSRILGAALLLAGVALVLWPSGFAGDSAESVVSNEQAPKVGP